VWLLRTVLLAVVVLVALAVAIGGRPAPIDPPSGVSGVSDVSGVGLVGVQSGLVGVPQAGGTTR
jgi:hypothetical protein